jgi:branched-chain amino acid transport system permease protein
MSSLLFFIEVLIGGLLAGSLYALVALGFVLIYKASSVFNFAQTSFVFFAAMTLVGVMELGLPMWAAVPVAIGVMVLVGMATERMVLRPLLGQREETLLMATIGLAFIIEGLAQAVWGVEVRRLDLGVSSNPIGWVMDRTAF